MASFRFQTNSSGPVITPAPNPVSQEDADSLLARLVGPCSLRLNDIRGIWKSRPRTGWPDHPEIYRRLGEQVLTRGEPLFAYDILREGEKHFPRDARLRQLLGLTLARSGAIERGNAILRELGNERDADGETLGILARTYKDLWAAAPDQSTAARNLKLSHEVYFQAYSISLERDDLESAYYNGINAAATALLLGRQEQARELASRVDQLCERVISRDNPGVDLYWALATRGEAAVILGNKEKAAGHYLDAAREGRGRHADFGTTRRQARLLLSHLSHDPHLFDDCFDIPSVVVFAGCEAGFLKPDPGVEQALRSALRDRLEAAGTCFGYASLIGLSDLLFLEEMISLEREAHVVMPLSPDAFIENLGPVTGKADWERRVDRVLDMATQLQDSNESAHSNPMIARQYTQMVLDGLGRLHSHALETPLLLLSLTHAASSRSGGSLADRWLENGDHVENIEITELVPDLEVHSREKAAASGPSPAETYPQRVMALLFADVAGYSKLSESEIPAFVQHFLGAVAQLEAASPHRPIQKNTWGDAFYFIFERIEDAGIFALELSSLIGGTDWRDKGISSPIDLRIALHAGPVYTCDDPIVQRQSFYGTHVSWVARIEPITPPGLVYASQPFAALVKAFGVSAFNCEYVGQVPLAKGYGDFPLYHVR